MHTGSKNANGYDAIAAQYIDARTQNAVGADIVRAWAQSLARGSSVLDIGCGSGDPVSRLLTDAGLAVSGVDASPAMIDAFRRNFPALPAECAGAENASLLDLTYDAIIAWGLMFLLPEQTQRDVISRVARALRGGGQFMFTAPAQACTWADAMTGLPSQSLGRDGYVQALHAAGLRLTGQQTDAGENHYFIATKD